MQSRFGVKTSGHLRFLTASWLKIEQPRFNDYANRLRCVSLKHHGNRACLQMAPMVEQALWGGKMRSAERAMQLGD